MNECVAVLDVGKTHLKLHVLTDEGELLEAFEHTNEVRSDGPYPHYDTTTHWEWLLETLAAGAETRRIKTIVPVTHGAAVALINGDGLVLPILDYEYDGLAAIDDDYDALRDPFTQNLSPRLPAGLNLGRQLFWQQQQFSDAFSKATALLPYPQYWAWRLSGVMATEVTSLGSHTDLWSPQGRGFSRLATRTGISGLFPPLRNAWSILGPIRSELAARTGLPEQCEVLCGIHDSNASYLRYIANRKKEVSVLSTGTWVVCMGGSVPLDRLQENQDMLANVDAFGEPVPCARFMGGREFEQIVNLNGRYRKPDLESARVLIRSGTMALPSFVSTGGPFRGQEGRIVAAALSEHADMPSLGSVYCALVADYCLDLLGSRKSLVVEGPFIGDKVFTSVLAALRPQQALHVSLDATGTVSGGCLLATWNRAPIEPSLRQILPASLPGLADYRATWRQLADA